MSEELNQLYEAHVKAQLALIAADDKLREYHEKAANSILIKLSVAIGDKVSFATKDWNGKLFLQHGILSGTYVSASGARPYVRKMRKDGTASQFELHNARYEDMRKYVEPVK